MGSPKFKDHSLVSEKIAKNPRLLFLKEKQNRRTKKQKLPQIEVDILLELGCSFDDIESITQTTANLPDIVFSQIPHIAQVFSNISQSIFTVLENMPLTPEEVIMCSIDVDPDTLNRKSKGKWVTFYIELPEEYDIQSIDMDSLKLQNVIPAETEPFEIGDHNNNGIADMMVKFSRSGIIELLEQGEQAVVLTGKLDDGSPIVGTSIIKVVSIFTMSSFIVEKAKIDFKRKLGDAKVHVKGRFELGSDSNNVDISEEVIVTIGPFTEKIIMEEKGKKGDKWEYKSDKGGSGDIKHMKIDWKKGNEAKFDIHVDKADLDEMSSWSNTVTITIQIGDDRGSETITMKEHKHHWDYHK